MTKRRDFLKTAGAAGTIGIAGLAGCTGDSSTPTDDSSGDDDSTPTATESPTPEPMYGGDLNFIMSPSEPQDKMMAQYAPVKAYLSSELGVEASLKYAANYSAVLRALGSGTTDIAETGPFVAALGEMDDKAEIALQRKGYGSYEYTSVWVTKEGSDIESIEDLEGKSVALADRLSASGSLFPLYMAKQAGLSIGDYPTGDGGADFSVQYAGGHGAAFKALESGQVDAAGVGQFIVLNDDRNLKDGYSYVEQYNGIPRAPICVSPTLSDEEKSTVISALEEAPEKMYLGEDGEADTEDDLWFSDVRAANRETYKPVIDVAEELGIKLEQL